MQFPNGQNRKKQQDALVFWQNPRGLLTNAPAISIPPDFAQDATNLLINEFGYYQVRPGLKKVTTAACGASVKTIRYVPIAGSYYTFLVDADNKFYQCSGSEPSLDPGTAITTLEGTATILPFAGYAVVLDGSYIKYFDGTNVKLAYDDGTGTDAAQHDSTCQVFASAKERTLNSGGNTMAGAKFTTQSFDSGYTIDLTEVIFWLKKTGSPTGNATVKIYSDSSGPDTLLATSGTVGVSTLTSNFVLTSFYFSVGDLSMSPSTAYYAVVEYTGGDGSNNITIAASEESGSGSMYYYDGTWTNDSTADALCKVKPGKPPKAKFGDVKATRLFVAGSPSNPGYINFSNANSLFDWSTTGAAGYVSAVDDNANSYPVGAIVAHYGDIYVFGQKEQPYLCKLIGTTPSNFALPPMWQKTHTDYKSILSLPNDVWIASDTGLSNLAGVQEYGDLRVAPYSNAVFDKFRDNWNTDAFTGYNPANEQLLIKLPGVSKTLACHLNVEGIAWTYYDFKGITPTAFDNHLGIFYAGASDGHLYKFDQSFYKDNDSSFDITLESGILEQPFGAAFLDTAYLNLSSEAAKVNMEICLDGSASPTYFKSWSNNTRAMQKNIHVRGNSIKIKLSAFILSGRAALHSLTFIRRRLSGRKNL